MVISLSLSLSVFYFLLSFRPINNHLAHGDVLFTEVLHPDFA